jgi:hypothetical protein
VRTRPRRHVGEAGQILPCMPRLDLQLVRQRLAGARQGSVSRTREEGQQGMNAQRSVWSPPPPTVAQKYATYFGGVIARQRYTERPRIYLWWTDADMKRLAYRELTMPDGLLALIMSVWPRRPGLAAITYDNLILFLDVVDFPNANGSVFYVVCDPDRVLRYGFTRGPIDPSESYFRITMDRGSWTWDGTVAWPLFYWSPRSSGSSRDIHVFACRVDTEANTVGDVTQLFSGYYREVFPSFTALVCTAARWVSPDPQKSNAVLACITDAYQHPDPDDYEALVLDYTVMAKYLPGGPELLRRSGSTLPWGIPGMRLLGTFPVGPAGLVDDAEGLYVVFGSSVVATIPAAMVSDYRYYQTTNIGLPYDIVFYPPHTTAPARLVGGSPGTVVLFFEQVRRLRPGDTDPENKYVDILVEYNVGSGRAVRNVVVPMIYPEWGMEREGAILAVPYMTSNKGRLRLP